MIRWMTFCLLTLPGVLMWTHPASAAAVENNASANTTASAPDPLLDWLIPNIAPKDALGWEAQIMRARLLAEWGKTTESIRILEALLAENPQDPQALLMLSALYLETDQRSKIQALLPNLQALPELQPTAYYLEGRLALWRNRVGQARARFEAALQLTPTDYPLHATLLFYRAYTLEQMGRIAESEQTILQAKQAGFRAHEIEERLAMARFHLRNRQAAKAIPLLERGLNGQTLTNSEYLRHLADSYLAANMRALALDTYSAAIETGSEDPQLFAKRAMLLRSNGNNEDAWEDFQRAIALGEADPALLFAAGISGLQAGHLQQAQPLLSKASAGLPEHATAHYLSALTLYLLGDAEASKAQLEGFLKNDHALSEEFALLQRFVHLAVGNDQTMPHTRQQTASNSESHTVPALMQRVMNNTLEPEAAFAKVETSRGERRGKAECALAFWLGEWYRSQGLDEQAEAFFRKALTIGNPDFLEFHAARWRLH